MKLKVDRNARVPIYLQLSQQIRELIFNGSLVDGYSLPSERALAGELGVHRNTIVRAYSELRDEGLLTSYQGVGYRVRYKSIYEGMIKKNVNWEALVRDDFTDFQMDFDELFSRSYEADIISFGGGVAAREPYRPDEIADVLSRALNRKRDNAYFYTPYKGDPQLRRRISEFMSLKGVITKPGNIQILSGNNQALDFILDLMLSPGDRILAQEPLSPDVHRTIKLAGGKLITVPVDEDGMICDNLEAIIESEHPRFIYVDSSFSNPTGAFLTIERRRKLLELSYRYRIPIIEDDEGSELYYDIDRVPSIKSMDEGNNVIYMYSFSLTMMPGISVSFVVADRMIIETLSGMVSVRIASLDWTPQMLMLEYMNDGIFFRRLDEFRNICRIKRDIMCSYLDEISAESGLSYIRPKGGVYIWVRLPDGIDSRKLLEELQKQGVTFIPGHVFYLKKTAGNDRMRLNYSYPTEDEIRKGMVKLRKIIKKFKQNIQIKTLL